MKQDNLFRNPDALVDAVRGVLEGKKKLDKVDPKELKGKHKERDDKDIDNDGDVDSSDKYLHKRRKAITKAMKESLNEACKGKKHVKEEDDEEDSSEKDKNGKKKRKDKGNGKSSEVDVEPSMDDQRMTAEAKVGTKYKPKVAARKEEFDLDEVKLGSKKDLEKLEKGLRDAKAAKDKSKQAKLEKELNALLKSGKGRKIGPKWMHKESNLDEAKKSSLQKIKDFDKMRAYVGKKPIFRDNKKKDDKKKDQKESVDLDENAKALRAMQDVAVGIVTNRVNPQIAVKKFPNTKADFWTGWAQDYARSKFNVGNKKPEQIEKEFLKAFSKLSEEVELGEGAKKRATKRGVQGSKYSLKDVYPWATPKELEQIKNGTYKGKRKIKEEFDVYESKMSEIDAMRKQGKTAAQIAKILKLPLAAVKKILGESVELTEAKKKKITKAEYDKVLKQHESPRVKSNNYKGSFHVYKKDGQVWNQTYSHKDHGLPTIEYSVKNGKKEYFKFSEGVEVSEGKQHAGASDAGRAVLKSKIAKKRLKDVKKKVDDVENDVDSAIDSGLKALRTSMKKESFGKALKNSIVEARRGRPPKNAKDGEEGGLENIQMQLRKSISLRGLKNVEFEDGRKVKVTAGVAQRALNKIDSLKKPLDKQSAVKTIAKSYKALEDFANKK